MFYTCFNSSRGLADWIDLDSIRVDFERPCPEDDVQCGQHGSS